MACLPLHDLAWRSRIFFGVNFPPHFAQVMLGLTTSLGTSGTSSSGSAGAAAGAFGAAPQEAPQGQGTTHGPLDLDAALALMPAKVARPAQATAAQDERFGLTMSMQ